MLGVRSGYDASKMGVRSDRDAQIDDDFITTTVVVLLLLYYYYLL